jgi:hypothetical protein
MFVKVTTRYKDSQLLAELPVGVILEVTDERAEALIKAEVAEEFIFSAPKANKKNKSEETKAEEVQEPVVEEPVQETETPTEDAWKEPEATETTGE